MADGLVKAYAARKALPGHAFKPDTVWQRELEASFPYDETPDQLAAIEEVRTDLEAPRPMDRLICGDVGYGKTEVAIRAAFKVVQDGRQVAVLVPTTILAQQHLLLRGAESRQLPRPPIPHARRSRCCCGESWWGPGPRPGGRRWTTLNAARIAHLVLP